MPVKQIILLYATPENSEKALEITLKMARKSMASVHVVELKHRAAMAQFQYPLINDLTLTQTPLYEGVIEPAEPETLSSATAYLERKFRNAGVSFTHSGDEIFLDQLIEHTMYADILVADAHLNLGEYLTAPIDASLQKLRAKSHCPFYLANHVGSEIEKVVFAYDGKAGSMQAIKSFSCLFPDAADLPVEVVSILGDGEEDLEQGDLLKRWIDQHFASVSLHILHGKIPERLVEFADHQPGNVLVVMGHHVSDIFTGLFHRSTAPEVLKRIQHPVFI